MKNTPYLTVRADQVMEGSITLWLALFSDTEFLNKETIEQTWKSVNFAPTVERYYRYVQQINVLRALRIYHATSQHDYSCAARNTQGEFEPKFRFVDGCCEFDVYSNSSNEEANTTRLNEVIHALPDVLEARL
ncbi:hypothetical protein [Rahnella inusitata]|uniref:hypothetical protein n=1 Tax=Rahnella inusitata TaxID=58169 RepID=UPI0039B100B5